MFEIRRQYLISYSFENPGVGSVVLTLRKKITKSSHIADISAFIKANKGHDVCVVNTFTLMNTSEG